MPGNMGPWRIAPGQVTDDSELGMSCLQGLSRMNKGEFDAIELADAYKAWFTSSPFDIGATTCAGLNILTKGIARKDIISEAWNNSRRHNSQSQSNGSLMRSTPLAVYAHLLS